MERPEESGDTSVSSAEYAPAGRPQSPNLSCSGEANMTTDSANLDRGSVDFKAQLDEAADKFYEDEERRRKGEGNNVAATSEYVAPVIEKISQYIPLAGKLAGGEPAREAEKASGERPPDDTPPHRPVHDIQIEGFLRDQHRSKKGGVSD